MHSGRLFITEIVFKNQKEEHLSMDNLFEIGITNILKSNIFTLIILFILIN